MAVSGGLPNASRLRLSDAQPLGHFVVKEAFARLIRLHPFAIDHELRHSPLARMFDDLFCRARRALHVDIFVCDVVFG